MPLWPWYAGSTQAVRRLSTQAFAISLDAKLWPTLTDIFGASPSDSFRQKEMIKFLENPVYNEANNISSSLVARYMLSNAYVFEADLLILNPKIIKKYHYTSDFLGIKKQRSDDWCFKVKDGIIIEQNVGGEGDDIWQMVGISYCGTV